jgi:ferredoxin
MKRRSFTRNALMATGTLAATALPYGLSWLMAPATARSRRNYLRPPGSIKDDALFVAACIGCGLCGEVCPPRCILFHKADGAHKVNTPYILAHEKGCILCDKCIEVCPTEALQEVARADIDMGIAEIDRDACYPWVDRGICGACVSICPIGTKAISFRQWNQYRPFIKQGCVGCGLCVEVCPHPSTPIWIVERKAERPAIKGTSPT